VTPNDDGVNDYFYGDGIGIVTYDIWIFDRWGNEIFHGDYLYDKWDGRANGGKDVAQQDVYVWKVRLTDVFDRKHNYIGTVTIVK
jgi:gliding motility-associated-like protein